MLPGLREDAIDSTSGERGDEADMLRDKGAWSPYLPDHFASAYRIHPERRAVHRRGGGFQAREEDRSQHHHGSGDATLHVSATLCPRHARNVQTDPQAAFNDSGPAHWARIVPPGRLWNSRTSNHLGCWVMGRSIRALSDFGIGRPKNGR